MKNLILTLIITLPLTVLGQGWEQTYDLNQGIISLEIGKYIQSTNDDNLIVLGEGLSLSNNSEDFLFLIKVNTNGDLIFTKTYEGFNDGWSGLGEQTSDDGFILTGTSENSGDGTIRLIKSNSIGEIEWIKDYENGRGGSVKQTNDGEYVLLGSKKSFPYNNNLFVRKLDLNGNEVWTNYYGEENSVEVGMIQQSNSNEFIFRYF